MDGSGSVLEQAAYTAWGTPYSGSLTDTPFGWQGAAGVFTDNETGLVLMGARYYSPAIGRFISRDPAGFVNGPNVYAYCMDNPVDLSDPDGMNVFGDAYEWGKNFVLNLIPYYSAGAGVSEVMGGTHELRDAYAERLYGCDAGDPDAILQACKHMGSGVGSAISGTFDLGMMGMSGSASGAGRSSSVPGGKLGSVGKGGKDLIILERYGNEAEATASNEAQGLVARAGHSGPKWVAEPGLVGFQKLGKPKNYTHRMEFHVPRKTIDWLKDNGFESKPLNEPGRYAVPLERINEFNGFVHHVVIRRVRR